MHNSPFAQLFTRGLHVAAIACSVAVARRAGVPPRRLAFAGVAMTSWLGVLAWAVETRSLLPPTLPGPSFLVLVFAFVGAVGAVLFLTPARMILDQLGQADLQLLRGIRVLFGASFLMLAALGTMPRTFGILDGFTHVGAGFLGLFATAALTRDPRAMWPPWLSNVFGTVDDYARARS